jgi:hypothetical protein
MDGNKKVVKEKQGKKKGDRWGKIEGRECLGSVMRGQNNEKDVLHAHLYPLSS